MLSARREAEIVRTILSGRPDGYAEIVEAYQDHVRSLLAPYCATADDLESACHAAFVAGYFKLKLYDPKRGRLLPWLLTVARSSFLDELRREKRHRDRVLRSGFLRPVSTLAPDEDLEVARQALERCLSELDESEADLLRERYWNRRSCVQIADAWHTTTTAVRKRLQRLRAALRACVERRMAASEEMLR